MSSSPQDLSGTASERRRQLENLDADQLTAEWLRRQLEAALDAWGTDETELDIDRESRVDF